jgi:hypothetical protein
MKEYKIWDMVLRKIVYTQDVVCREVGGTSESKGV